MGSTQWSRILGTLWLLKYPHKLDIQSSRFRSCPDSPKTPALSKLGRSLKQCPTSKEVAVCQKRATRITVRLALARRRPRLLIHRRFVQRQRSNHCLYAEAVGRCLAVVSSVPKNRYLLQLVYFAVVAFQCACTRIFVGRIANEI